jgi:surfactin synthase thioesterase subunit
MNASIRLFLIPYAGVSAQVFLPLGNYLPAEIALVLLEPPGHGSRSNETPLTRIDAIVDDLISLYGDEFNGDFAVYGHSYGGRIADALTRELVKRGRPAPAHLFVSGCGHPGSLSAMADVETLSDDEFIATLRKMGSTLPDPGKHPDLYQQQLRLLRADFTVLSKLSAAKVPPIDLPITVFWSPDDLFPEDAVMRWKNASTHTVRFVKMNGNHFFPLTQLDRVAEEILLDLRHRF